MFLCIMVCGAKAKELVQYQQGVLASQTAMIALQDSLETIEDDLLEVVEERASFPGGDEAYFRWLKHNVRYPAYCLENDIQGMVIVSFVVEKDGWLSNINVVSSPDKYLSQEVLRVVKITPKWIPATRKIAHMPKWADPTKYRDKFLKTRINLPIVFQLPTDSGETIAERGEELDVISQETIDTLAVDTDFVSGPPIRYPEVVVWGKPSLAVPQYSSLDPNERIYDMTDEPASFPGGEKACIEWLARNIKYPPVCQEQGIQGRVIVSFIVDKEGNILEPKVIRSPDEHLADEALRVINLMPKWNPAKVGGRDVNSRFNMPIMFRLGLPRKK